MCENIYSVHLEMLINIQTMGYTKVNKKKDT